jgi:hypothetical protein
MATAKKAKELPVRLIVAHTGLGKPGAEVMMEAGKAEKHEALGLLEIIEPEPAPKADKPTGGAADKK